MSSTQMIDDVSIIDHQDGLSELVDAQEKFPLIEIARAQDGIIIGGIKHSFPVFLSDIYVALDEIQEKLLSREQELNSLQ